MNLKDSYLHGSDQSALVRDLTITSGDKSLTITYATPDSSDATKYKTKTLTIPVGCITGLGTHATDSTKYIPLAGSTTSAPITGTLYIKDANGLYINSNNADYNIWHIVGNSGDWGSTYGFNLLYLGTGGDNNNDLVLYSHNQNSTHKEVYRVHLDGNIIFGLNVTASNALSVTGTTSLSALTVTGASSFLEAINGSILGNAATASRLLNVRTIWGLNFDGSGNVSGALSGATTGSFSSNVSVGGTLTVTGTSTYTGKATFNGNITTGAIYSDGSIGFYTSGGGALRIYTGGVLTSDSYSDASYIPTSGIYSKGNISTASSYQFKQSNYTGTLSSTTLTAARTWTLPDATGTIALTSDIPTVTNYYWGSLKVLSSQDKKTKPLFADVLINDGTTADTGCTLKYDNSSKCLKFVF